MITHTDMVRLLFRCLIFRKCYLFLGISHFPLSKSCSVHHLFSQQIMQWIAIQMGLIQEHYPTSYNNTHFRSNSLASNLSKSLVLIKEAVLTFSDPFANSRSVPGAHWFCHIPVSVLSKSNADYKTSGYNYRSPEKPLHTKLQNSRSVPTVHWLIMALIWCACILWHFPCSAVSTFQTKDVYGNNRIQSPTFSH